MNKPSDRRIQRLIQGVNLGRKPSGDFTLETGQAYYKATGFILGTNDFITAQAIRYARAQKANMMV